MKRLLCIHLLALVGALSQGRAEEKKGEEAPGVPPRKSLRAEALKEFDKDGDGKLNEAERKAMMEARMAMGEKLRQAREKEFDKDGDGKLNEAERKAMLEARMAMAEKFRLAREKEFDKDGDGKLNEAERTAMMEAMKNRHAMMPAPQFAETLKRFDKDGDGKLNEAERKVMMEARAKKQENKEKAPAVPPAK